MTLKGTQWKLNARPKDGANWRHLLFGENVNNNHTICPRARQRATGINWHKETLPESSGYISKSIKSAHYYFDFKTIQAC